MAIFKDRGDAGRELAEHLKSYIDLAQSFVLALPRGGVPIAFEIAKAYGLPLDVMMVRKLGTPGQEELAMGAIAENDICLLNEVLIQQLDVSQEEIEWEVNKEKQELLRRAKLYRQAKPLSKITGKKVILVDDGIATGFTVQAAILALRAQRPVSLILAVPVAAASSIKILQPLVDEIICPHLPKPYYGVGQWYEAFPQVSDSEVIALLEKANEFAPKTG